MKLPDFMLQHTVTVAPHLGHGSGGAVWGDPVEVRCFWEPKAQALTDSEGAAFTSTGKALCQLDDLEHFPLGSEVIVPDGRTAWVRTVEPHDPGRLPLPASLVVTVG